MKPDDLTKKNIELISSINKQEKRKLSKTDQIIDAITAFCGSMIFVWTHVFFFAIWIVLNIYAHIHHFDPYPFQFLTLFVSLEAIFLSTFILISQNRQSAISEKRNQLDLQINILSEQENTKIIQMLKSISDKLEIESHEDEEINYYLENTDPSQIVQEIEDCDK